LILDRTELWRILQTARLFRFCLSSRPDRLAALLAAFLGLASSEVVGQTASAQLPAHGEAGPGLEGLDRAVLRVMQERHIPAASLAVARNRALVLAKGYGWAEKKALEPVRPRTLFALASVSDAAGARCQKCSSLRPATGR
jgi:CubicO group peptidase (beta-lactamase class C family)